LLLAACFVVAGFPAGSLALQEEEHEEFTGYRTYEQVTEMMQTMADHHPDITSLQSLGKTLEGRDVWMLQVANPAGVPVDQRPALLVAANFEGDQLIGSELALATAHHLLHEYEADEAIQALVDEHVFYIVPRVNPDGAERYFAAVKGDVKKNTRPYDDDNDGRIDEDGPNDLNGDGLITVMRVEDPAGAYMVHPEDARLMKRADPSKGEEGTHSIYWEGTDDDNDGFYNEDGPGGVDLNRNFQHAYPYYEADAGPHMVSENEARALLDFVVAHRNIAVVLTYGESDNLVSPPDQRGELAAPSTIELLAFADASNSEAGEVGTYSVGRRRRGFFGFGGGFPGGFGQQGDQPARRRPPAPQPATTVNSDDLAYFETVSEKYKEITGIEQLGATRAPEGAFFQYAYFQYGVPAFSTPGWGLPEGDEGGPGRPGRPRAEATEGSGAGDRPQAHGGNPGGNPSAAARPAVGQAPMGMMRRQTPRGGPGGAAGDGADLQILHGLEARGVNAFVDWTPVQHPTLGTVEVGGFRPYALSNPEPAAVEELGARHAEFALYLASLFPDVRIASTEVVAEGGGIFKISAEVENVGFLPTALAHGVRARAVNPVMVQLQIPPEDLISGDPKTSFFPSMDGSGSRESLTWIIQGEQGDQIELLLRSQKSGTQTATLTLR
jgi:hypothetical protein